MSTTKSISNCNPPPPPPFLSLLINWILFRPNRLNFAVKIEPELRLKPGDVVTFEYDDTLRLELPVNPKIIRVRKDVSWESLLNDYNNEVTLNGNRYEV